MRLECPACAATYDVPDTMLKPGQPVRCVRCHALWQPELREEPAVAATPKPLAETPAAPTPRVVAAPPPLQPGRPPATSTQHAPAETDWAPILAWGASLAILAGAIILLVIYRAAIIAAWPPAGRLFSALGLG